MQQESAAGWVLLPIYVGLQAPSNGCGCAASSPSQASAEGTAAADDAVNQAEAVGIAPGNPIYDDMEAYSRNSTNTTAVLAFLSAWTTELHARGYASGVYSSATSGVTDLVNQFGTGYAEPDQIWNAEWNGQQSTTQRVRAEQRLGQPPAPSPVPGRSQRHLRRGDAQHRQRLRRRRRRRPAGPVPGRLVRAGERSAADFCEIAGGAPLLVNDWAAVGGAQPYTVITQQQFDALNPVPANGTLFETQTPERCTSWRAARRCTSPARPVFAGDPQPLLVDEWDIDNAGNPLSHLNPMPANGTFLTTTTGQNYRVAGGRADRGDQLVGCSAASSRRSDRPVGHRQHLQSRRPPRVPSRRRDGGRGPAVRRLLAVRAQEPLPGRRPPRARCSVDDHGLVPFSAIACRVPNLAHKTLAQVKTALLKADCHLGKMHDHLVTRRRHVLRVIKQVPQPAHHARGLLHGRHHARLTVGRGTGGGAVHSTTVPPQVSPPPNAASSTRRARLEPALGLGDRERDRQRRGRGVGEPAHVVDDPARVGSSRRSPTARMIREFAWW